MDFTREPIIESVITPREGCKLVIRSSKGAGQEEYFVDAVEVVSFGNTFFLRSLEKPKAFLVPASDYEILEIRETRMVLKNVGLERSIKIGGGKEPTKKASKESAKTKEAAKAKAPAEEKPEPKRRERKRHYRKKKGREESTTAVVETEKEVAIGEQVDIPSPPQNISDMQAEAILDKPTPSKRELLAPPSTLISESIERYRGNELFKEVFTPSEDELLEKTGLMVSEANEADMGFFAEAPTLEQQDQSVQTDAETEQNHC